MAAGYLSGCGWGLKWLLGIWGVANGGGIWIHLVCGDRLLGVRVAWATVNGLSGEVSSQKNFKTNCSF